MTSRTAARADRRNLAAFVAALVTWLAATVAGVTVAAVSIVRGLTRPEPQTGLALAALILAAVALVAFMATITTAVRSRP